MATLSDLIEAHILGLFNGTSGDRVNLNRSDLSLKFECVPSQINYVLNTRFTLERGYMVESRRGGGGYVCIIKVSADCAQSYLDQLGLIGAVDITSTNGQKLLERLMEEGIIDKEEKELIWQFMKDESLPVAIEERNAIRGKMLKNLIGFLAGRGGSE